MPRRTDPDHPSTSPPPIAEGHPTARRWSFLSNHAHVLVCLRRDPDIRIRDLAELVGITERAVQNILVSLEEEGLLERRREGRRNTYELHLDTPLPHPLEAHRDVGSLIEMMLPDDNKPRRRRRTRR